MKKTTTLLLLLLTTTALFSQTITGSISWDGLDRSYRLHIPPGYVAGEALPLVFNFHGYTSNAGQQEFYSDMNAVADTANFFVVYPQGVGDAWNVGWNFGSTADDVGFTNALIDTLNSQYSINLERVYSCGMSNGGFFSYKLACELNDRIAKIASVTGSMLDTEAELCMPENPIPVMQIHGTADPVVGYNGTAGLSISVEALLDKWLELNACEPVSDTIFVEDIATSDFSTAQLIQYRDCEGDVMIAFYKIIDGQHTWPGAAIALIGTNYDFHASTEIWNFFNDQYPVEQTVDTENLTILTTQSVKVFPNPLENYCIVISTLENMESIQVFNSLGQLVYVHDDLNATALKIDNINWQPGIYFLRAETEHAFETLRIIKL